jgi:hypothetical protein
MYLQEIAKDLVHVHGVAVHESTIWRALQALNFTCKKVHTVCPLLPAQNTHLRNKISKLAIERKDELREAFVVEIGQYSAEQTVFVDESAVDKRTPARRYGRALSGRRAEMRGHFVRGTRCGMQTSPHVTVTDLISGTRCFLH